MSQQNNTPTEEEIQRIKLKRHLWPDEVELKTMKSQIRHLQIGLIIAVAVAFFGGWMFGSFLPIPALRNSTGTSSPTVAKQDEKISTILDIMSSDWYFSKDIPDVTQRLTNEALYGMTTNDEDLHTSYMSKEEIEEFTQSINMNFVGIGVQFVTANNLNMIDRVFKDSPAEKAGVLPGDIINKIDGTSAEGLDSDEIKNLVTGEEGTIVTIEFLRNGEPITLEITRGEIAVTTNGEVLDGGIGYLQIYQFGDTTAKEVRDWLDQFEEENATKLIIDLRDNGGGYLDALAQIASDFLPEGTLIMQQEYNNGKIDYTNSTGGPYTDMGPIVILINENTASASEVLTMALKEQREDVTLVGTTSYGKGTVQVTRSFTDGSALKYTTSRWLSPTGVWVNEVGITPDEEIRLHELLYTTFTNMDENEIDPVDTVSEYVKEVQYCLDFMDYDIDRTDGYFSVQTQTALKQFEADYDLPVIDGLDSTTYDAAISAATYRWNTDTSKDLQLLRAEEILNG